MPTDQIVQYCLSGITVGSVYAIVAIVVLLAVLCFRPSGLFGRRDAHAFGEF